MNKKISKEDMKDNMRVSKSIIDVNVSIDSIMDGDRTKKTLENKKRSEQDTKKQEKVLDDFTFRSI